MCGLSVVSIPHYGSFIPPTEEHQLQDADFNVGCKSSVGPGKCWFGRLALLSLVRLALVPQIPSEAHVAMLGSYHTRAVETHDYSTNLQSLKEMAQRIKEKQSLKELRAASYFSSAVFPSLTPGCNMLARGLPRSKRCAPNPSPTKGCSPNLFPTHCFCLWFLLESHSPVTVRILWEI